MVNHDHWSRAGFQAEALSLCSKCDTAFVGQSTYADADVRVVAAHFFTLWPLAAGSSRVLDIIEDGPSHRVERGDGVLIPTFVPHLIVDCFAKALETMAALGNQRAVALTGRIDLPDLLKRTDT